MLNLSPNLSFISTTYIICIVLTASTFSPAGHAQIRRSSHPHGFGVSANINVEAANRNAYAGAVGDANEMRSPSGAAARGGDTRIQGHTKIKATQKDASSTAVGKENNATNEAGIIGGR